MADTDPDSSHNADWPTLNGSYRGQIRRRRIVILVVVVLILIPLAYLVAAQNNQTPANSAAQSANAAAVNQVTSTQIPNNEASPTAASLLLQSTLSPTPVILPGNTSTTIPASQTPEPTEAATALPTSTTTPSNTPVPVSDTPTPTPSATATRTATSPATATSQIPAESLPSNTPTSTSVPGKTPKPTSAKSIVPTLLPHTGADESNSFSFGQLVALILLATTLILLGSALSPNTERR